MGLLLHKRQKDLTEAIGRGNLNLALLCVVCTWGACVVVGAHARVYASGGWSKVGCLRLSFRTRLP